MEDLPVAAGGNRDVGFEVRGHERVGGPPLPFAATGPDALGHLPAAVGQEGERDRGGRQREELPASHDWNTDAKAPGVPMGAKTAPVAAVPPSLWRPTRSRLARLLVGLTLFGAGEAALAASELGNSPWTVLGEGVALHSPLAIGTATVAISFFVLLLWIPLRQRPGLGTIANALVIGLVIDATLFALPNELGIVTRWLLVFGGVALVAVGSGFYLTAALGPGPRDGLMTGLSRTTGISLRVARGGIELTVLVTGFALGGTVGAGTLIFALAIGPGVQLAVERLATPEWLAISGPARDADPGRS